MRENFALAVGFVLKKEGGYSNDPDDPGGETNFGISKRYHPDVDIKNLTATDAAKIYFSEYWMALADALPFPMDVVAMDMSVNPGIQTTKTLLVDCPSWEALLIRREQYYLDKIAAKPVKAKYFFGWTQRILDLHNLIHDEIKKQKGGTK